MVINCSTHKNNSIDMGSTFHGTSTTTNIRRLALNPLKMGSDRIDYLDHTNPEKMLSTNSVVANSGTIGSTNASSQLQQSNMTTTRVKSSTSSSRVHHVTSSSSSSSSSTSSSSDLKSSKNFGIRNRLQSSLDHLDSSTDNGGVDVGGRIVREPLVTFPDDSPPASADIQQKSINNFKKSTSLVKDGSFSAEQETMTSSGLNRLQSGDLTFAQDCEAAVLRARLEMDGVSAESGMIKTKEARSMQSSSERSQEASENVEMSSRMKISSAAERAQRQTSYSSSHSVYTSKKGMKMSTSLSSQQQQQQQQYQIDFNELINQNIDDLDALTSTTNQQDIDAIISKYSAFIEKTFTCIQSQKDAPTALLLHKISDVIQKVCSIPTCGHEMGRSLCTTVRSIGGLDVIMRKTDNHDLQFSYARLLVLCLSTPDNLTYVTCHGLDTAVHMACVCSTRDPHSVAHSRIGTGILEYLFQDSETTCSDVIRLGGLDALLFECRKSDVDTLRHCAGALANLALYGGADNQEAMIKRKVPMWLFPLAFHNDDNVKYYACLTITVLVANAEIEADVLQSGTLDLVEPFVTTHNPSEFARSNCGQSKTWLKYLVPVLSSKREEARNLAAFHFCMEAGIKKQQGTTSIFRDIPGAIDSLKLVASCPNAVASKFAAQALRQINEEVPHKLSQQVPLWSTADVAEWVKQIGFSECVESFVDSRVDGDLLLQLSEENLRNDIGLANGIKRKRFARELHKLKRMADYSSRDSANINQFLYAMGPEFSIYTYSLLNAGVETKDTLRNISEDQLLNECSIMNSIHRFRIMDGIRQLENGLENSTDDSLDKCLDVFVSYRRSNGSQLASLLKVHLQLRGFSVFIDVERLEAGKFDNNLLQSIQKAKNFLLVLTPNALQRCLGDRDLKDWVHREIVAALQAQCNIIPIIDNFQWPEAEELPEDMRQVCHFNGVRWIHDYQDACVDKLERFMRGELNTRLVGGVGDVVQSLTRINKVGGGGGSGGGGDNTPGTPSANPVRQVPNFQRMHSNDSGGSRGSDKDTNNNINSNNPNSP